MSIANSRLARWLSDDESEVCMNPNCNAVFNFVSRRHHCRRCGLLFCDACTNIRCLIPRDYLVSTPGGSRSSREVEASNPQRVCNICRLSLSGTTHFIFTIKLSYEYNINN